MSSVEPPSTPAIRILLVVGSLPPSRCGVGDYTRALANALAKHPAIEVAVLSRAEARDDHEFELIAPQAGWRLAGARSVVRQIRQWAPGIVHFQFPAQGYGRHPLPYLLPLVCHLLGIPVVQTWHEYARVPRPRLLLIAAALDGLVAVRPAFRERMSAPLRRLVARKAFRMIPNASAIPAIRLSNDRRRAVRERFGTPELRLVVFFGFVYRHKGVDRLFDICDPARDVLVLASELHERDRYHRRIRQLAASGAWAKRCFITGFLPPREIAELLAAADVVVLPFRAGGGSWNTSLHAATEQGTFVLTTSTEQRGYDPVTNVYAARPEDLGEMRAALNTYAGRRIEPKVDTDPWNDIAVAHVDLYRDLVATGR